MTFRIQGQQTSISKGIGVILEEAPNRSSMRGGIPLQPHLGKTDTTDFEALNTVLGSQVAVPVEALTAVNRISFLQLPTQGAVQWQSL